MSIRDTDDDTPKRGPGRPRKQPPSAAPLFITRDDLAHRLNVSRRITYDLERDDPDFPVVVNVAGMKKFSAADAERYVTVKVRRAREERRAKAKMREAEAAT